MKITVLTGGVGGAKFLLGVKAFLGWDPTGPGPDGDPGADQVTAIVNIGDDIRLHGLQVCPDLDSCLYTLSGVADTERGWGRKDETWTAAAELAAYGAEAPWFALGDKDIATHLVRTRMLDAGYPLSAVTAALAAKWRPGVTLLPMSDERVETHVVVADPTWTGPAGEAPDVALHFQEWWTRYRASLPAKAFLTIGSDEARPANGVLEAIAEADLILVAPSNPVVSIGPILAVPGIKEAVVAAKAPVVGVSPLIAGKPLRGHADACLQAIGVEVSAQGVGRHYGARSDGGLIDAFLVAEGENADVPGVRIGEAPLLMTDPSATAKMVHACLELTR
ncbi:LPPG:FO 2-phospho-L-lactate transferase [Nakamurella panacisegetis]|uniref:LPPG:FO 2-phospho-L-lactate transferase n=1 Tax=Nakamurella panacisegetis TaxID=1090615 RepID=A0A1H0PJ10_9ACTN|nr:2-phospho-L-lactate transferase [Nakamurella panacisegetis]SDP04993.1 LPPG:FO 2-phospho-L-lactate transferase [Nakamurella panacisegetis]